LSIPVLITVIILNFTNLKNIGKPTPTPTPDVTIEAPNGKAGDFYSAPIEKENKPTDTTPQSPCTEELGPVTITSPSEGDTVNSNPVEVDISYDDTTYCAAVWSYRINGGSWSEYDDRSVALYNLPNGPITFDLKAKSIIGAGDVTLTRSFIYNGQSTVPTTASSSGQ
jgi:hypothetical protein